MELRDKIEKILDYGITIDHEPGMEDTVSDILDAVIADINQLTLKNPVTDTDAGWQSALFEVTQRLLEATQR